MTVMFELMRHMRVGDAEVAKTVFVATALLAGSRAQPRHAPVPRLIRPVAFRG